MTISTLNKDPQFCFNVEIGSDIEEGPQMDEGADNCKAASCSDSTSDTSEEDKSYVPFITKGRKPSSRGKSRGPGRVSQGSQGSGHRKKERTR